MTSPKLKITIEYDPETPMAKPPRNVPIIVTQEEKLGFAYTGIPDAITGAAITLMEQAIDAFREKVWDCYPPKAERAIPGNFYVAYPCRIGATQILQALADGCKILSSIYHMTHMNPSWAVIVIGPISDPKKQEEFEGYISRCLPVNKEEVAKLAEKHVGSVIGIKINKFKGKTPSRAVCEAEEYLATLTQSSQPPTDPQGQPTTEREKNR